MSSPRSLRRISKVDPSTLTAIYSRCYVKWCMALFRCYCNSDPGGIYPTLKLPSFSSIFLCWIDNGGALVTQI